MFLDVVCIIHVYFIIYIFYALNVIIGIYYEECQRYNNVDNVYVRYCCGLPMFQAYK